MIGTIKKTTIKLKIKPKNRKINNKNYRALELKVQHNSKLNKNKPGSDTTWYDSTSKVEMILWHSMESTWVGDTIGTFKELNQCSMSQELTKTCTKHQTHMENPSIANWTD